MFGIWGSLILVISIASYSITHFLILFLYFIIQAKPRLDTSHGALPKLQMAYNIGNGNPSRLASLRSQKEGYRKRSAVYPTAANTRLLLPSFFVLLFPTRMPLNFYRPTSHGSNHPHTPTSSCRRPRAPPGLAIRALNIRDGRGFWLAQAIQAMERGVFDVIMLTETKIQSDVGIWLTKCPLVAPVIEERKG